MLRDLKPAPPELSRARVTDLKSSDRRMSALGHKRTFRSAIGMSALPPKADIPQRGVSQVTLV
jgi:hypothetical protein